MNPSQLSGNLIDEQAKSDPAYWTQINEFKNMEDWTQAFVFNRIAAGDNNFIAHRFRHVEATIEKHYNTLIQMYHNPDVGSLPSSINKWIKFI